MGNPVGGYGTYANYGFESSYGGGAVSARTFGRDVKITINQKNNIVRHWGIGARNASTASAQKYEGNVSIEFVMANAIFWRAILGSAATTGSSPYTHTFTESTTVPSFAIDTGSELGSTDEVTELQGCKVASWNLVAAVGEPVKIRLECPFKTLSTTTSSIGSQTAESFEPFTFAQGSLQLPSGTTIGLVQSIELSGSNDIEMLWGLGSRLAQNAVEKKREYNFKATVAFNDLSTSGLYLKFLGDASSPYTPSDPNTPSAQATLILTFTNGLSSTNERSITITLANAYIDEHSLPKDVNEVIKEDVTGFALSGTSVVWVNNTSTDSSASP